MTRSEIRKVSPDEVTGLVTLMRDMDKEQKVIVERHLRNTVPMYAGYFDNEFAAVWGVIPPTLSSNQAYIWVYTTEAIIGHEFLFVRYSQRMVEELLKSYERIVGVTLVGEDRSIRWLKWLGAEYGEPDGKVLPFVIRRKTSG